jgi:hypothetical protein
VDWVFDNFQLILAIAGAIAWWLNQRAREKAGESADYDQDGVPEAPQRPLTQEEFENAERTRRIQEEIRRKIAERAGLPVPAAPEVPELVPEATLRPLTQPEVFRPQAQEVRAQPPSLPRQDPDVEVLARQRRLAEQMEELERARAEAAARAATVAAHSSTTLFAEKTRPRRGGAEKDFLKDLADVRSLRKAVVLREVLGTPAGLR